MPRLNKTLTAQQLTRLHELDARLAARKGRPGQNVGLSYDGAGHLDVEAGDVTQADVDAEVAAWTPTPVENLFKTVRDNLQQIDDATPGIIAAIQALPASATKNALIQVAQALRDNVQATRAMALILYQDNRTN